MPRRAFQQQTARSRSSSAPGSSQRRDIPRPAPAGGTATAPRQEPDVRRKVWGPGRKRQGQRRSPRRDSRPSWRSEERRRAREQPSSQAPKVQLLKCVCVGCSFNKNAYILTKRAFSSSLNKCGSPCPTSEQCRSASHTGYSRASNDQAAKAATSVHKRVESYSGNLALATQRDRAGIYSSIQMQTAPFQLHGAVSNIASKCPGSEARDWLSARERSSRASPTERAGERFLQPLLRSTQEGWGAPPNSRSQTHQQSALQTSVQDDNAETDPGANSPGDWFASVDLKDAYFHIQIAPHHRRFLRFAFENTAYQYSVLPFGLALAPRTFSKCVDAALSPLRASRMRILNYLDDWLILAQSRDTLLSHIDSLLIHLESLGLCINRQKSILAPSQSITYLGVCMDSLEMRARLSRERAAAILSYLRHFREGSSVHLKKFQRLLGLMASASAVCHLGLLHMRPLQLWLKTRVPWTAWTSGRLSIAVTCGCIEALAPWRNPDLFSRGVPLGLVTSRVVVTTDASTLGWGAVCEGMPASGRWSEPQIRWHINRLELEAVFLALKEFRAQLELATCTDSHRQHVCSFVHKSPGRHSFQGFVRAGSDFTAMGGFSPSIHQSNAHPRSLESRGGHAFKEENSSRGMEVTPRVGSDDRTSTGKRRGIYSLRARMHIARCSSPCPTPRWKGTRSQRTGRQPGFMCFLWSKYCLWCYARSGRSERQWYS